LGSAMRSYQEEAIDKVATAFPPPTCPYHSKVSTYFWSVTSI
jgi:hypothetical protein